MPDTAPPADGSAVTSSWLQTMVREQVVRTVTSSTRPTAIEGGLIFETDTNQLLRSDGTNWICLTPQGVFNSATGTTTSTSYTATLSGSPGTNPAITIDTGTTALVMIGAAMSNSGANENIVTFAVSGATTLAASADYGIYMTGTTAQLIGRTHYMTGLTAGSNTFTMNYRVAAGTGTFLRRSLVVVGL